jgi:ABC-2 type transport system permease protein
MSIFDLMRAEYILIYAETIRRKSELVLMILYPYLFTGFVLLLGYSAGSLEVFKSRIGVDPAIFMATASFTVMSLMIGVDDVLWRPLWDMWIGTLPYLIASPVDKFKLFTIMPLPRATLIVLLGFTSLLLLYILQYGLSGVILVLLVTILIVIGVFTMVPLGVLLAGLIHSIGESWRILSVVRPIIMVLLGAYYPRFYMPLVAKLLSYTIPPSHIVESVQRVLVGLVDQWLLVLIAASIFLTALYTPPSRASLKFWEKRKVSEGVKIS